jgi:hypothetical protein
MTQGERIPGLGSKRRRIPDPDSQHWLYLVLVNGTCQCLFFKAMPVLRGVLQVDLF